MLAHRRAAPFARAAVALLACAGAALRALALPSGAAAASGDLSWYYADDSPTGAIDGIAVAARGGNVLAGGQTQTTPESIDWVVVKWLASGTQAWVSTFAGQAHADDWLDDVACDKAGNVYACGQIGVGSGNHDSLVTKYRASDGKLLWKYVYAGPQGSARNDWAHALVVDAAGSVYVTGSSETPAGNKDLVVMRLSPTGKATWVRRYDGAAHATDYGSDIDLYAGSVYVVGQSWTAGDANRVLLARYGSGGNRAWLRTWRSSLGNAARVRELALDGDGNAVVAGVVAGGAPDPVAFLVSWTSGGRLRWSDT